MQAGLEGAVKKVEGKAEAAVEVALLEEEVAEAATWAVARLVARTASVAMVAPKELVVQVGSEI